MSGEAQQRAEGGVPICGAVRKNSLKSRGKFPSPPLLSLWE